MKKYILTIASLSVSYLLICQKIGLVDTSKNDYLSDYNYSKKCAELILKNDYPNLRDVSDQWLKNSPNEPSERLHLLLNIQGNRFDQYPKKNLFENLLVYKAVVNGYKLQDTVHYLPYRYITGYPVIDSGYNKATSELSAMLNNQCGEGSVESALTSYYSNHFDSLFIKIQEKENQYTSVASQYQKYATRVIVDTFSIRFGMLGGIWLPTGNNQVLGNHLTFGFQSGIIFQKGWGVHVIMCQRYNSLPDSILFTFNDTLSAYSNRYRGGFYGVELSKKIYASMKNEVDIFAGVALDGFNTTYDIPDQMHYVETSIHSVNFNAGLTYRFIFRQKYFSEVQLRYNLINYGSQESIDMSGHALTLNLGIGFLSGSKTRMDILRSLDYKF